MKRNVYLALWGLLITFIICHVISYITTGFLTACGFPGKERPTLVYVVYSYFISLGVFATYEAVYFFKKYKQSIEERERLKTSNVQTQLDNLRNQINPHFLFNSLNTLMNLIPKDSDRAMTYLNKLSKFYRYSVGIKEDGLIPLQTEIDNAKIYADLLHERFGENLEIVFEHLDSKGTMILPMTLQLLIENAVKHNIVSKNKPLKIEISEAQQQQEIVVENTLQPKIQAVNSTGMGLENIKERFAFFTDQHIRIEKSEDTFLVYIPIIRTSNHK